MGKVRIENIPSDVHGYVVARLDKGKLWYYGTWETEKVAQSCADTFDNGLVLYVGEDENEGTLL